MSLLKHVFISYGRKDSLEFAATLNSRLVASGLDVWFDFNNIPGGVDYQKQIDDGIPKSDNFIFIISPHATNSEYCRKEVNLAVSLNKRLIPIMHVEEITQETWQQRNPDETDADWEAYKATGAHSCFTNMHPEIGKINWNQVCFQEGVNDFETSFQALIEIIRREQDYVRQHTELLNAAIEWENNQKQRRYLLIGEDRQRSEAWLAVRFKQEQPPCVPSDLHYEYITESIKNANNLMTQVFLSHAEEDRDMTDKVRRTLMRSAITTWVHHSDIEAGSDDFQVEMERGVIEADNFLFLMSPLSLKSHYCQQELNLAIRLNKRIVVMLASEVDDGQIPDTLRNRQYIDLTDNKSNADYLVDERELLRVLKHEATYYNEHKVLLTKALKWEQQQHNPCVLLQGYELQHALAWRDVANGKGSHGPTPLQIEFIEASNNQTAVVSPDVFISYSRADADFARKLNNRLQQQKKRTWFDQESIASGADFQQEI